jgi:hypothetical protein
MQRSRVEHTPVNDYNRKEVADYLSRGYDEATAEAAQVKSTGMFTGSFAIVPITH